MAYEFEDELELEDELEDETEGELEEEMEDEGVLEGEGWLNAIGNIAGSLLGESEEEDEGEFEDEISPVRKIYPDAMMEHLGELAAEAESEEEAVEHFLPLVGMAASKLLPVVAKALAPAARRALPHIAKAIGRATPQLTRGVGKIARILHRSPAKRHLLKTVPAITRRTVGHLARQAAHGRRITPKTAVRTLARQAHHLLGSPQRRTHALRRHNYLERRFHPHIGRGAAHRRYGVRYGYGPGQRRVGGRVVRGGIPGVHPGSVHTTGAPGGGVVRIPGQVRQPGRVGRSVGGVCACGPCPSCGGSAAGATAPPAPAYCRCCGQVIR